MSIKKIKKGGHYKNVPYRNNIIYTKVSTIRKQIDVFLQINNINTYGKNRHQKARIFLEYINVAIPKKGDCLDILFNLYESSEFNILKAHNSRDINVVEWNNLRVKVFDKYGKVCLCCKSIDNICIDHIKPYSKYPELALDFENMQPLCRVCNSKKGNRSETDYR